MNRLFKLISFIILNLLIWQLVTIVLHVPKYIFPSPIEILNVFIGNFNLIVKNSGVTIAEALVGFLIANTISIIIAFYVSIKRSSEDLILPIAIFLKTIPIIAITPLLILWFGAGIGSKIATAALICFFPSLVNILRGVKSVETDYLEIFKVFSSSRKKLILLLIFPSILPYLFSSLKISSSLAIVGALVGEFIGANKGLGFLVIVNYYNLNTPLVFAALMTSSLIGIALYYAIDIAENKFINWSKPLE